MNRSIVLAALLSLLPLLRGAGQSFFTLSFPEKVEDSPGYQRLLTEKAAQWALVRQEIRDRLRSDLPESLLADLKELALHALTGDEAAFNRVLGRIREAAVLPPSDLSAMLRAEQRLRVIRQQLDRYLPLLNYTGERMKAYVCDTTLADVRAELAFYEIQTGDRIAEIGAGDERFAAAMATAADSLTLFINDIDSAALFRIAYHLQHNPIFRKPGLMARAVAGDERSTGLENAGLDKVVIRNAFHHFDAADDMLRSIRQALYPHGVVYLKELYREDCGDGCCEKALPEAVVKARLATGGLEVVAEQTVTDRENRQWRLLKAVAVVKFP